MDISFEYRMGSRKCKEKKEKLLKALDWFFIVADTELFPHIYDKTTPLQICPSYDQCILYNSHLERGL